MGVHRFLVTGTDDQLTTFHISACLFLNDIERRGQTILYTCFDEHVQYALQIAKMAGVTVQEWNGEEWEIIAGSGPGFTMEEQPMKHQEHSIRHHHAEAFCLMTYRCQDCRYQEIFWNSRDGVTPLGTQCPNCGGANMVHIHWSDDKYAPDHIPEPGQGIWIDLPEELRRPMAAARIHSFEGSEYEVPEERRDQVIQTLIREEFARRGLPFLIRWPGRSETPPDEGR